MTSVLTSREVVASGKVVHPLVLAYFRGVKRFEAGRASPPRPADDDPCTSPEAIEWVGWMMGRADELDRRRRTMRLLGIEDDD